MVCLRRCLLSGKNVYWNILAPAFNFISGRLYRIYRNYVSPFEEVKIRYEELCKRGSLVLQFLCDFRISSRALSSDH